MESVMVSRLKNLLESQGISQKELAVRAGVTEAAVSHYIKGDRVPRGAILLNIANALNVTADYLLNGEEPEKDMNNDIEKSYRLLARNAKCLTIEQKTKFLALLLQEDR